MRVVHLYAFGAVRMRRRRRSEGTALVLEAYRCPGHEPESQGRNLAVTVSCVPCSLDRGELRELRGERMYGVGLGCRREVGRTWAKASETTDSSTLELIPRIDIENVIDCSGLRF